MGRFVSMTVGKTHSGKTTFAKELEQNLPDFVVIDQDNHAGFLTTYYKFLCNSNLDQNIRNSQLMKLKNITKDWMKPGLKYAQLKIVADVVNPLTYTIPMEI